MGKKSAKTIQPIDLNFEIKSFLNKLNDYSKSQVDLWRQIPYFTCLSGHHYIKIDDYDFMGKKLISPKITLGKSYIFRSILNGYYHLSDKFWIDLEIGELILFTKNEKVFSSLNSNNIDYYSLSLPTMLTLNAEKSLQFYKNLYSTPKFYDEKVQEKIQKLIKEIQNEYQIEKIYKRKVFKKEELFY